MFSGLLLGGYKRAAISGQRPLTLIFKVYPNELLP